MRLRSFRFLPLFCVTMLIASVSLWAATRSTAEDEPQQALRQVRAAVVNRPQYKINATIDYELLTFKSTGEIKIPVTAGDAMRDVVFFIYANASGVGGDDDRHKNIAVDRVSLDGKPTLFTLNGAVLRVQLAEERRADFTLKIDWHGVVPRSPAGSGGLMDMMGGMGSDLGGLLGGLGGAAGGEQAKSKNVDYGLYTYGNGVLSLGSFWYPSLAVRKHGKWIDDAPEGLGDVGYSEASDFEVIFQAPQSVKIATTGDDAPDDLAGGRRGYTASNVRDFAVLMSEDFVIKEKPIQVGGKSITVEAYTTKKNAAKTDKAIDIASRALEIFSKRFGPYPYDNFKVVEGPIRGGAGGMEFSGMTSIASMLYQDMGKQLEGLSGALGVGGLDKILGGFEGNAAADKGDAPQNDAPANPATEMIGGILGQQKEIFDSLFEMTIAHEVAHQWWAIGVGSDSQRAPYVDESLANYSAMLYFEDRYGRAAADKMADLHLRTAYSMGRMLGGGDAPVNLATAAYKNNMQYGAVVYAKGALFYDALRKEVGDEAFFAALREYYGKYQGKLAQPRAFREIVEGRVPAKKAVVAALFKRWIEETHGDEDISGGKVMGIQDLLGGLLGGLGGADVAE